MPTTSSTSPVPSKRRLFSEESYIERSPRNCRNGAVFVVDHDLCYVLADGAELWVGKQFVEAYNGRIAVTSGDPGQGIMFTVSLPAS